MFNIGFTELLILGILGLLIIGPEKLPDLAKKLARLLNDLKRAKDEIMSPVEEFKNEAERFVTKTRESIQQSVEVESLGQKVDESKAHNHPEETDDGKNGN